jgi:hypothetical protein
MPENEAEAAGLLNAYLETFDVVQIDRFLAGAEARRVVGSSSRHGYNGLYGG